MLLRCTWILTAACSCSRRSGTAPGMDDIFCMLENNQAILFTKWLHGNVAGVNKAVLVESNGHQQSMVSKTVVSSVLHPKNYTSKHIN